MLRRQYWYVDSIATNVGVLDKSVAILAALADEGPLSLAALVSATGLSRPTAHRLAAALEAHRLVGRDEAGRYRLGLRLLGWAGAVRVELALVEAARPVLEALRDETGESAQLFVREGDARLCVAASERPAPSRPMSRWASSAAASRWAVGRDRPVAWTSPASVNGPRSAKAAKMATDLSRTPTLVDILST